MSRADHETMSDIDEDTRDVCDLMGEYDDDDTQARSTQNAANRAANDHNQSNDKLQNDTTGALGVTPGRKAEGCADTTDDDIRQPPLTSEALRVHDEDTNSDGNYQHTDDDDNDSWIQDGSTATRSREQDQEDNQSNSSAENWEASDQPSDEDAPDDNDGAMADDGENSSGDENTEEIDSEHTFRSAGNPKSPKTARLTCLHQGWCNSKRAQQLEGSVQRFMNHSKSQGRPKMDEVLCPVRDPSGRECDAHVESIGDLMTHVRKKHAGAPANAVIEWLGKLGLASKCERCHSMLTTRGLKTHMARCNASATVPRQPSQQQHNQQPTEDTWQWDLMSLNNMERLCQPGLSCSDFIHPHVVNKVADTCIQIRTANVSRTEQVFATILLLQTVTNHTRFAKKQLWKATELKRLYHFKHGDWSKIIDNICAKATEKREQMSHRDEIGTINNEVRKGHTRNAVLSKAKIVRPTHRQLHERVMPQKEPNNAETSTTACDGTQHNPNSPQNHQQQHNNLIDKTCLEAAIKHVKNAKHVTGIAASVWGQIYKAEPAIVIEMVQEQISNKFPADVRRLLTGVHYNVLGYDESDKLRPVGSLDAITKIAQVYLLEAHKINVKEIADKTVDHAIQTDHGMAKMTATLKAKVTQAIDDRDSDFAVLKVDITSAFPNSNRQHMRTAVSKLLPQFLGMFDFLYARPNHHTFNTSDQGLQKIEQRQGIIQGSELSMLFFMLYTHLPLSAHLDQINNHVLKYADDIYVYGPTDEVLSSYKVLKDAYSGIELDFNPAKQELYLPARSKRELDDIKHLWPETKITNQGITCLGAPVGNSQWTKTQLDSHLERATANMQLCAERCSAQVTLKLLQHTASAYQHIVTVLPPDETLDFASDIDKLTANTFNNYVIGVQQHQVNQNCLPAIKIRTRMRLRDGGFGILSLKDRVPVAVVSTAIKIQNDAEKDDQKSKRALTAIQSSSTLQKTVQYWTKKVASRQGKQNSIENLSKMSMAEMMQPVYQEYVQQARDNLDGEMLQAWVATQHVGANDVIAIAPNREETTLTDYELRYAIYQRLGLLEHVLELDRFASPTGKCLACNRPNITAAHFSNCGHSCKEKHDLLVRLHHEVLETAGVNARVELQVPNAQRKIDIFYQDPKPNSITTKNIMADLTVIQAYQPDHTTIPDTTRLLKTASRAKSNKYKADAANWRARVQPLCYTTFGAISKDARDWLDSVEQAAIAGAQYFPGIDRRFRVVWRENISFEIARQTAKTAEKGMQRHRHELAGVEESE